MLWGVERAIAGLAKIGADTDVQHKLHVVLPGSPNRGIFGGDGAYGEVKSAFDAIVNRARAEKVWSSRVTFAHPKIGWVRGTGLMGGNDPLVEVVERHGLKTYSTAEIAVELLNLSTRESRIEAAKAPLDVDLTGGLGNEPIDIKALRAEAMEDAAQAEAANAKNAIASNESDTAAKTLIKRCQARVLRVRPRSILPIGRTSAHVRKTKSSSCPWVNLAHGAPAAPVSKPNSASIPTARWICLPARCSNWHGIWAC